MVALMPPKQLWSVRVGTWDFWGGPVVPDTRTLAMDPCFFLYWLFHGYLIGLWSEKFGGQCQSLGLCLVFFESFQVFVVWKGHIVLLPGRPIFWSGVMRGWTLNTALIFIPFTCQWLWCDVSDWYASPTMTGKMTFYIDVSWNINWNHLWLEKQVSITNDVILSNFNAKCFTLMSHYLCMLYTH